MDVGSWEHGLIVDVIYELDRTNMKIVPQYWIRQSTPRREYVGMIILNEDGEVATKSNYRNLRDAVAAWSDPVADIQNTIITARKESGKETKDLLLVVSVETFKILCTHPKITERVKYASYVEGAWVAILAAIFGLKDVIVIS